MKWTGYLSNFNCTLNRSFKDVSILSRKQHLYCSRILSASPQGHFQVKLLTQTCFYYLSYREREQHQETKKSYIMKKARFSLQYLTTQARMLGMFNIFINLIGPHTKQIHTYIVHNFAYYLQSLVLFLKKNPNIRIALKPKIF